MALAAIAALGCGGAGQGAEPAAKTVAPEPAAALAPAPAPGCAGIEARAREVWSPKIRGELDFSVRIYQGEILAAEAELAVNRLDEFTSAWIEASEGACRSAAEAGEPEGGAHRALSECLDRALETQRAVIGAMKTGGKIAIAQAQTLPEAIRRCSGEQVGPGATTDMRDNPFGGNP